MLKLVEINVFRIFFKWNKNIKWPRLIKGTRQKNFPHVYQKHLL